MYVKGKGERRREGSVELGGGGGGKGFLLKWRREGRGRRGSGSYLGRESSFQVFLFFFFNSISKSRRD